MSDYKPVFKHLTTYREGLMKFNENNFDRGLWANPKKGTAGYNQIQHIRRGEDVKPAELIVIKKEEKKEEEKEEKKEEAKKEKKKPAKKEKTAKKEKAVKAVIQNIIAEEEKKSPE